MTLIESVQAAVIAAILLGGIVHWVRRRRRAVQSLWPAAEAMSKAAGLTFGRVPNQIRAEIDYFFHVQGDFYSGRFSAGPFATSREAMAFLDAYRQTRKLVVRYDPENPSRSKVFLNENGLDPADPELRARRLLETA